MKLSKQFLNWLFADFAYSLYELAETRFALSIIPEPIVATRRKSVIGAPPVVYLNAETNFVGIEIPKNVAIVNSLYEYNGIVVYGDNSFYEYILPYYRTKWNSLPGTHRNLVGLGGVSRVHYQDVDERIRSFNSSRSNTY